jgi:predicted ATPase
MQGPSFPYPLSSWTLGGFRAIRDETRLELGGLNLLVGANSAGKSSVLHSILLAAQTLTAPTADRPLVLNGPQVRLGWADDCVHEEAGNEITIGFGLNPSGLEFGHGRPAIAELAQLTVLSRFVVPPQDPSSFLLARSEVTALLAEESAKASIAIVPRTAEKERAALEAAGIAAEAVDDNLAAIGMGVEGDIPDRTVGVHPRQFLPHTLAVVTNAYIRELSELIRLWLPRVKKPVPPGVIRRLETVSPEVGAVIRSYVEELAGSSLDLPDEAGLSAQALAGLPDEVLQQISLLHHRSGWLAQHATDLPFRGEVDDQLMVGPLDAGVDLARWWFSQKVRHLGPLRAGPQPFYGLPEAASIASVGKNGEYTAAVLSNFGRQRSRLPMPDGRERQARLGEAVDAWVEKLGLLDSVHPSEGGKYGYELNVSIEGVGRPLDLTTVGVGVSQALPIIVLGLISGPGSLLLFEQPELHLHPNVQAALGDFFLALARSGRQLLIETHSEYLINRLRRRQKTDAEPDATELTRLFFFERAGAAARVTPTRIGPDGSMPDWPRGFLDTSSREVEEMVLHKQD